MVFYVINDTSPNIAFIVNSMLGNMTRMFAINVALPD